MNSLLATATPLEQAVLYVDVLGFAEMTMTAEETPVRVPPYEVGHWQEDYGAGSHFWTEKSPVSHRLLVFHRRLEELLRKATKVGDLRAMLFSDGAFIVIPDIKRLAVLAGDIMRACLLQQIPVRMGLAVGTFQPLKFSADTVGETGIYTSLFYGTGVVRAHYAERSGKGLRIFIHPSVIEMLPPGFTGFRSSSFERLEHQLIPLEPPQDHASHEMEYLHRQNPIGWHHSPPDDSASKDEQLWQAVIGLRSKASAEPKVQQHYTETFTALNRMRRHVGRDPLSDAT